MKKTIGKVLSLLLAMLMLLSVFPITASANTYVTNATVGYNPYRWNHGTYTGYVNSSNLPDGEGTLYFANDNADKYTITWNNTVCTGIYYTGGFSNGYCYGNGKRYYDHGVYFEGYFNGAYANVYNNTSDKVVWSGTFHWDNATYQGAKEIATSTTTGYVSWDKCKYIISYNANGGSGAPGSQTKVEDTNLTLSTSKPTRTGYTFINWNTKADGSGSSYSSGGVYSSDSAATLYAQWAVSTYTVSYNANGGSSVPKSQTKIHNQDLTLTSSSPYYSGYSFKNWNTKADGRGTTYASGGVYSANVSATLYAQWTPNAYTISYDANGGTGAPDSQVKYADAEIILSSQIPVRDGYTFLGWAPKTSFASARPNILTYEYESDLSSVYATPKYQPGDIYSGCSNLTLYAVWEGTGFIYYDANGGSNAPATQTFCEGETIKLSGSIPSYNGYIFEGWAVSADSAEADYQPYDEYSGETITLYAIWSKREEGTYIISYDANGGTGGPDYQIKYEGQSITLSSDIPTRYGYQFRYWQKKALFGNIASGEYLPGSTYSKDSDLSLIAYWRYVGIASYNVETYIMDTSGEYELVSDEEFETTGLDVVSADYTIEDGFYLNEELSVLSGTVALDGSLILKVYIDRNKHCLTFDDGTIRLTDEYYYGAEIGNYYIPQKEGYTFLGWSEDGENVAEVVATMPDRDIEYTAMWSINSYTITFIYGEVNDNAVYKTITQVYGTDIEEVADPEFTGYTFLGWDTGIPETMPAENLTITALWSVNEYTITYKLDGVEYFITPYESAVDTVAYGNEVTVRPKAVKEGYTVSNWTFTPALENGNMPASDVVASAISSINSYTLTVTYEMSDEKNELAPETHTETLEYGNQYSVTSPAVEGYTPNTAKVEGTMGIEDVSVTVTYSPNAHTVTWNVDGEKDVDEYVFNDEIVKPDDPTKEGYTFEGWSEDGETVVEVETTVPDRDIEYIAVWSVNSYTITLRYGEVNNDAEYKTITKEFGKEIEEVADPEFTGYTFSGWDKQIPATMPAQDMTITALWSVNEYKVTYILDGVEYFATPYESAVDTFTYGSEVTVRPNAVKEGYTVSDWVFTPALENGKMPAGNVVANATSTANKYTLTVNYVMNDGSDAPEAHIEQVTYGAGYSVETPAVTGYTPDTELVEGTMDSTEGKTITVTYDINSYDVNITYEISDGKADAPEAYSQTVEYGKGYSVVSPDVPGYTPNVAVVEGTMGTEPVNTTVIYTPNAHTITWNVDGEKTPENYVYGDEIVKPADPEKEGYTFEGWSEDGETVVEVETTVPDRDIEYIAVWSINSYTITYNVDGVKYDEKTYEYNADVVKLTAPVKQGYVFSGWDSEEPEKMPAHNLVLNGTFSAATDTKYTVETYTMNLSGEYDKASEEFTGTTGEPATAEYTVPEGFSLNADKSELEGVIASDGSLVLKVYLDRNRHNISFDDGTNKTEDELYYGDEITKPEDPEKEGNEFLGWSEDGETVVEVETTVPDRDIEYIAVWSVNSYTITLRYGEVNNDAEYKTITKEFGKEIDEVSDPDFTGYTFSGWDKEIPATMPSQNMTITALWSVNEYKITYKLDGVEYFAAPYESAVDTFDYGSDVIIRPKAEKEGYTVSDWVFTPELVDGKMPAGDVVANATSSVNTYTLTFTYGELNEGKVYDKITAEYGSEITAPVNPGFSGYVFREWDKEIPATMPAEDRTINALWDNGVFTITYKLDGEDYPNVENAVDTYFYGETVTVREKAAKEGYTVSDWSFAPALENGKMPAGNVIANATSAVNEYTVTWIVNGSSTVDNYTFGAEIVKPADPEMSGKVFKGWSGEIPATMPARNLVFVASFDAITHTATFVVPDENGSYTDETGTYEVVKTVIFEEGQTTIAEPAVPERDGYVGEWEDYTIGTEDIVIKAIYTIKDSTNTDELITEKTADEKDGGVITINLNAYSKAKTIKTDEKSQPLDVVIIVDQSGSMTDKLRGGETKQKELQNQAKALVASLNSNANATGANHRVAVVGFSMGGKAAGGFSAYQNTEILTVPGGAVNYKDATDSNYKNALMSVKNSYTDITNAISRTKAGGATSADLGFDMAAKIFANSATQAGEPEHKKIIIFITDGVPTTATEFDTGVANCAITRAKYLKAQDVTIYTVAISDEADPNNTTRDYNKFLHATSSNYKAASSVNNLGEGRNEGYFLTVRDSAELQQKLENISIRINPATAGFYAVTLYDTVTKEFTMTVPQETAFRENVIEKYGISNADITVDRKADGTTYVEVKNITPYAYYDSTNVMQGYKADITFDVTANENAVDAGEYPANTDEAGVVLDGYAVGTFEPQSVTVTEDRCIVEFIIGNDTYEIREVNIGDSITAPECSYAAWNIPAGTTASNRVEKFFADYGEADRTVTWHIGEDTITQHYATGQIIVVPEIDADLVIAGWSPAVEVCVGYTDLEYTALFSEHTHHYERISGSGICTEGRAITYKCSVCNAKYTEKLPACEHELESVAYKTNDATLVHIFCKNCLYSEKANTLSFSMTYQRSDYFDGTVADLHINNPGNKAYDIRIPLSSLSDKCQANPRKIKIIHYKSDGRTENCSYVIDGDYIVLRCTSFSYYVFTTDEIDESINSNTIDCILNGHQFEYKYNNDATVKKDGTETEVCSHCGAKGKTRTAKGTKLSSDVEYTLPANFKTQTAAYKTYVTVTVTLKNVPSGAKVYIDGKEATVNGNTYSADIGQVSSTKNIMIEVRQGTKVLDSATLTVKVDAGFFAKLISFFSNFLFNLFKWKQVTINY